MATYTFDTLLGFEIANIALPSGYTKLNYLQSDGSGNQYIETNYTPIATTGMNLLLMATQTGILGMGCDSGNRWSFGMNVNSTPFYHNINTSYRTLNYNSPLNTQVNFKFNYNNDGKIYLGNSEFSFGTQDYPIGTTFWLFRLHGRDGYYFKGNTYYCEFTEESNSVQKLIPCEREADNVLGMYDVVNDTFIEGTGTFASGGDAPPAPNFQNGDEIIISSTKNHYHYQDGDLVFWYQETEPLVFKGITFEQTDYWQIPESVFRGFSFEIVYKKGGSALWHGMV